MKNATAKEVSAPHICPGRGVVRGVHEYMIEKKVKEDLKENDIRVTEMISL